MRVHKASREPHGYEPTLWRLPTRKVFDIVYLFSLEIDTTQPWQQRLRDGSGQRQRLRQRTRRFIGSLQSNHDDFGSFDVNEDDYYDYCFLPTHRMQMEDDEYLAFTPTFRANSDVLGLGYNKEGCPGYLHDREPNDYDDYGERKCHYAPHVDNDKHFAIRTSMVEDASKGTFVDSVVKRFWRMDSEAPWASLQQLKEQKAKTSTPTCYAPTTPTYSNEDVHMRGQDGSSRRDYF
eukprot:g42665.t1